MRRTAVRVLVGCVLAVVVTGLAVAPAGADASEDAEIFNTTLIHLQDLDGDEWYSDFNLRVEGDAKCPGCFDDTDPIDPFIQVEINGAVYETTVAVPRKENFTLDISLSGLSTAFDRQRLDVKVVLWDDDVTPFPDGDGINDTMVSGEIQTVSFEPQSQDIANQRPSATFSYAPSEPSVNESVSFDAGNATDADGTVTRYEWDFDGDGTTDATGETATHSFADAGDRNVTLTVTDDAGATASVSRTITVATGPSVADYSNQNGVIDTEGLRTAIPDWASGELETATLRTLIRNWAIGDPVR